MPTSCYLPKLRNFVPEPQPAGRQGPYAESTFTTNFACFGGSGENLMFLVICAAQPILAIS